MEGKTHLRIGVSVTTASAISAVYLGLQPELAVVAVGAGAFGSLLPDADEKHSTIFQATHFERRTRPRFSRGLAELLIRTALWPVLYVIGAVLRVPLRFIALLPHRGPTHRLVTLLSTCAAIEIAGIAILHLPAAPVTAAMIGFAIGFWLHILGDRATIHGTTAARLERNRDGKWKIVQRRVWILPERYRVKTGESPRRWFLRIRSTPARPKMA